MMLNKGDLIELANTGVEGQGYGLAAYRKGIDTQSKSIDPPLPAHLSKPQPTINLKQKLGRDQVDINGRRLDKPLFTLSREEIKSHKSLKDLNFADFLPNSIKKKSVLN